MKIRYLGTAAAEGFPAMFCQCEACRRALAAGGKDIRLRSGALINDSILLDLTPDIYYQKLRYGLDLSKVQALVVTHSHSDHFDGAELTRRSCPEYCSVAQPSALHVYGNEAVCSLGRESLLREFGWDEDPSVDFSVIHGFDRFSVGDVEFTAIPASHDPQEECLVFLIRQGEKAIFYGNDTGLLGNEAFKTLEGGHLDLLSLDCTFGLSGRSVPTHMNFQENLRMTEHLRAVGCVTGETRIIATHFSHNCGQLHGELEEGMAEYGIEPAYDGLEIVL